MNVDIIQGDGNRIGGKKEEFPCHKIFSTTRKVTKRMKNVSNESVEDSTTNYIKLNNTMIFIGICINGQEVAV